MRTALNYCALSAILAQPFIPDAAKTVLDAIANMGGLSSIASTNVWLARPTPEGKADRRPSTQLRTELSRDRQRASKWKLRVAERH